MSVDLSNQIRDYAAAVDADQEPMRLAEITDSRLGSDPVRPIGVRTRMAGPRQRRAWGVVAGAAAVVLVLVGSVALVGRSNEPRTSVAGTVAPTTLIESTPITSAESDLPDVSVCGVAATWSRVCDDAAGFGGAAMWSIASGGPGLVAAGGEYGYSDELGFWTPEDIQPLLERGGDGDAVAWTSRDGASWTRVPHDEAVFGGD
ncbi:unnamed protein product, partial [marine sediment metagenome]